MAILSFDAQGVQACIARAMAATSFMPKWDGPIFEAKLLLVVGHGVQIMSNGVDCKTLHIPYVNETPSHCLYADGLNPFTCDDWMQKRRAAFHDLTGIYHTDILVDVQTQIDRGADRIRLSTDGHTIRVFTATQADYMIGGTYQVPSGLGGSFYVELLDVNDMIATVQNTGNCEDFDEMQPYKVPLDELRERETRRAA